ncbi:hypothetical protein [Deinococcus hopiensis]|uniref:Uncharacterized protein n=1 Tax=Deinococcus hopiensis KR-140 TaxID=695939 RepID=A0A1W1VGP7_9DEIO|nr:hypothetical protein [Deinococcus hopiensis]SMB92559.1 hypothetical protein SAMN00790413_01629 [Deinococcus hopiensis KR-140]
MRFPVRSPARARPLPSKKRLARRSRRIQAVLNIAGEFLPDLLGLALRSILALIVFLARLFHR